MIKSSGKGTKITPPINMLLTAVILATVLTGFLGWLTYKSFNELLVSQKRNEEVVRLEGIIIHYDEVLTMSARMAAATGNAVWEKRYRVFEPALDQAIKKLINLHPKEMTPVKDTDYANIALVQMEKEAFALVQENKRAEASRILFSPEYEKQKEIYSSGMVEFYKKISDLRNIELKNHENLVSRLQVALGIFIICSFWGWINIFNRARRWNNELGIINEQLDHKVKEQIAQLLNASKMSALGEMAGGIAHEINTPLAIIGLRLEQMEKCINEDEINSFELMDCINVAKATAIRIAKIIKGLKFFAHKGAAEGSEKIRVASLIDETLSLCSERSKNHGVKLEIIRNQHYQHAEIECRAVEISQVLLNLLNNAFDAVANLQEKWIQIEVVNGEQSVDISVTDSGRGIPKDIQEKIMQPFFTTKEIGKGTGLGLSISNGIMASHQGKIYIDNNCLHTRFTITLPKVQSNLSSMPAVA